MDWILCHSMHSSKAPRFPLKRVKNVTTPVNSVKTISFRHRYTKLNPITQNVSIVWSNGGGFLWTMEHKARAQYTKWMSHNIGRIICRLWSREKKCFKNIKRTPHKFACPLFWRCVFWRFLKKNEARFIVTHAHTLRPLFRPPCAWWFEAHNRFVSFTPLRSFTFAFAVSNIIQQQQQRKKRIVIISKSSPAWSASSFRRMVSYSSFKLN